MENDALDSVTSNLVNVFTRFLRLEPYPAMTYTCMTVDTLRRSLRQVPAPVSKDMAKTRIFDCMSFVGYGVRLYGWL